MPPITLREIAERVGYSKNTVSLALRDARQIPQATRDKIHQAAEEMGYRPNPLLAQLMAQLRNNQTAGFQAKLALVNAFHDRDAFSTHPTIPAYVRGCTGRGRKLGYEFDTFWLFDPQLRTANWLRILRTRGIKGLVVVGLMDQPRLPAQFEPVCHEFPCVVTGLRTEDPALSFCCTDHHNLTVMAFRQALQLGYRRPALVMESRIDQLVEGRFCGAFMAAQRILPAADRLPLFLRVAEARAQPDVFLKWFRRHQPDVILTLNNIVLNWLKSVQVFVPRDVGLIQLEWRPDRPDVAGMNQHNDVVGETAVDMVISQIHHNETGVPAFPRATLVGASWVDGPTVRPQTAANRRRRIVPARR